jgi:hypothetical protein
MSIMRKWKMHVTEIQKYWTFLSEILNWIISVFVPRSEC